MAKPRILVVEDNALIANTLALILEADGFQVIVAHDGLSGLEAFRSDSPDLVLSDIVMPKLNGIEMAKKIQDASAVPVLLVSGQSISSELLENAAVEGYHFKVFPKPFHPTALMDAIRLELSEANS